MRITTKRFLTGVIAAAAILGAGTGTALATTTTSSADASASIGVTLSTGVVVEVKGKNSLTVDFGAKGTIAVDAVKVEGVLKAGVKVDVIGVKVNGKILASLVIGK